MDWRKKISAKDGNNDYFQSNKNMVQKMNNAIEYIENHLNEEIDFNVVAKIACCSGYHFQRFFPFMAEIPLSEYIRRRRLTLAAFELQSTNAKVIDIAIKYGYESPEAFARAFKLMHGITPTAAKEKGAQLKAYPRITFNILIKGDAEMNYRIEQKKAFNMFGAYTEVSTINNQNFETVPKFWETCRNNGTMEKIRRIANIEEKTPLHAAMFKCTDISHSYLIGYFAPASDIPNDFTELTIPASTWAVFYTEELTMAEAAKQSSIMWKRIFTEWFATSGYELTPNVPEVELHHSKGNGKFVTEIYIPITKK
jgi:AraC family transcriptional regulator